jgi:hypothetical protein
MWGVGSSHEINNVAGAEAVVSVEGNMCGTAMRGSVALPGSKATSRKDGTRRNLGDLTSPATISRDAGHSGKLRRRSRWGRGEGSDGCVVPVKPRTMPISSRRRRRRREGGRLKGRQTVTHAPDSVPGQACTRSCEPANWRWMGRPSPELWLRPTFSRSPVRESRTPGSERGGRGNPVPYRDCLCRDPGYAGREHPITAERSFL